MSWLKEIFQKRAENEQSAHIANILTQQKYLAELKEKWKQHTSDANRALGWWNYLQLDQVIDDLHKSRLFGDAALSRLELKFGSNVIYYGTDWVKRTRDYRTNIGWSHAENPFLENSLEEALNNISPHLSSGNFLSLSRMVYTTGHKGDGETWGSTYRVPIFTLQVTPYELQVVQENTISLGRLDSFNNRNGVEKSLKQILLKS